MLIELSDGHVISVAHIAAVSPIEEAWEYSHETSGPVPSGLYCFDIILAVGRGNITALREPKEEAEAARGRIIEALKWYYGLRGKPWEPL